MALTRERHRRRPHGVLGVRDHGWHPSAGLADGKGAACLHSGLSNGELHQVAEKELAASPSKKHALRNIIDHCQGGLRGLHVVRFHEGEPM